MGADAFGHLFKGLERDPVNVDNSLEDDSERVRFKRVLAVINLKTLVPPEKTQSTPLTGIRRFP